MPSAFSLDKNRVRYAYLKANSATKVGLEKKVIEKVVATSFIISDILEVDFGIQAFATSNNQAITFDITFSEAPTVIAIPDDNINMSVSAPTTTTVTLHTSDVFTGNVYWIALNKTDLDGVGGREVAMLVDTGTVTMLSSNKATVTFNKVSEFNTLNKVYGLSPTILISASENVNLYITDVDPGGFTLNASEVFTGTAYWTALMIRKL